MATIQKVSGIDFANISKFDGVDISAVGSINFIGKPPTGNLLLDTSYGSGAEAAYSVRKLRTAYTGAAIQVQATTGGATAEIGFDVDNNLDTATLLAFAGTNEVRVSIWYDQSLNLNNAVQTTVAQRPIVVAAGGALVEIDGRAAMNLDGSTDGFDITSNIQGAYSIFTIGNPGGNDRYYQDSTFGSRQFIIRNSSVAGDFSKYQNGTATSYLYGFTKELVEFISNAPTILYTNTLLMRYTNSGAYLGDFSEYIIYTSDKSGTNQTSIQENIGDYYTQNTPLLDTYSGAAAAYSLRLLDSTYTGFAIKVQDNVGGATQDIGFDVFGELDTVSLLQYAGSNDVFVETWYDQSGSGNNATQPTSTSRPQIVSSGVVIVENGKPAVTIAASDVMPFTSAITTAQTMLWVGKISTFRYNRVVGNSLELQASSQGYTNAITGTEKFNPTSISINGTNDTSSPYGSNLVGLYHSAYALGSGVGTSGLQSIGWNGQAQRSWSGPFQELIIYSDARTTQRTSIETNINTFYNIYTPTPDPLLLNLYPGSAAAYSLRKLNANYTGSAILVQDTVGGATKAIGFDANGDLDTAELLAYAGSNDVLVATWFDQSGSGNDATQGSSGARPKIVSSGVVIVENGKPAVENILSGAQGLNIPSFTINLSDFTCTLVSKFYSDSSTEGKPVMINGDTQASYDYRYKQFSITRNRFYLGTSTVQSFNNSLSYTSSTNQQLHTITPTNGYVDGTSAGTFGTAGENLDLNPTFNYLTSGDIGRDRGTHANTSEVIIWTADQSGTPQAGIETNIGGYYDIVLPGLLDENPGAAAAYSLRRLSSTYTGSAVRVQRADNVGGTTDIGFDGYGDLDTAALTTAAAGNSMVVVTWFDQSGSGNDATQGTSANRPKIYDGTTGVVLENGKPAVEFDGTDDALLTGVDLLIRGTFSVATATGTGCVFGSETGNSEFLRSQSSTSYQLRNNVNLPFSTDTTVQSLVYAANDSTSELAVNGATAVTDATLQTDAFDSLALGRRNTGVFLNGNLQEVVIYETNKSSVRTGIETNIGGYYDIPLPGLLDENPGAAAAYSLRRLSSTYTGSAIQVQRADNVGGTHNIGFDSYGDLDTTALTTAAAGNSMVVATWYDQSGNSNDATQISSAARPKIYDGTTGVVLENGKPAVSFDGTDDALAPVATLSAPSEFTVLVIATPSASLSGYTGLFAPASGASSFQLLANVTNKWGTYGGGNQLANSDFNSMSLLSMVSSDGNAGNFYKDGVSDGTFSATEGQPPHIGGQNGQEFNGTISEIISYGVNKSTTDRTGIETNIGGYYDIPLAGLLDENPGAAAAYSLRRLSSTYTGSAIQVQRADNVGGTTDIGFDSYGDLDTAALTTAAAGNDMVVATWYDQSGNSNDASQATSANRPKIYDGTTGVVTENGKPAMESDGVNTYLQDSNAITSQNAALIAVATPSLSSDLGGLIGIQSNYNLGFELTQVGTTLRFAVKASDLDVSISQAVQILAFANYDGTTQGLAVNSANSTQLSSQTFSIGSDVQILGRTSYVGGSGNRWTGTLQEIVLYNSSQSSNRTDIETNINTFYSIY